MLILILYYRNSTNPLFYNADESIARELAMYIMVALAPIMTPFIFVLIIYLSIKSLINKKHHKKLEKELKELKNKDDEIVFLD